ncbi:MAG: S8 family serine peptidase [Candidatus Thermoplasmatota archaeon]|nr:S8 family serine peptidase [Candidatus Thermoplasmatota archaeon]
MIKNILCKKMFTVTITVVLLSVSIFMITPMSSEASDIANPAVKAKQSNEYSPNTAWELGYTGKGINIAIMDTGVDDAHPSLKGKMLAGVDFTKPELFFPRDGSYDPDDTNGHGTTCAGIATGTGEPEKKYQGTAPDAMLIDVRIGTALGIGPGEIPYLQDIYDSALEGIEWTIKHKDSEWEGAPEDNYGIDILSLSWGIYPEDEGTVGGSDGSDEYSTGLNRLVDAGVVVVVSCGNEGPDNDGLWCMGAASKVITVGATDDKNTITRTDDVIADYSSRGPRKDNGDDDPYDELKPDVVAPGTNIIQAEYDRIGDGSGNGYGDRGSGTSYASPNVAGIVALMLEANPDLTPKQIKDILRETAEPRGTPEYPDYPYPHNKWNRSYGYGVVDAYEAVKTAKDFGKEKEEKTGEEVRGGGLWFNTILLISLLIITAVVVYVIKFRKKH